MSRGINKVILIGNIGSEIESKNLPSGDTVVNFSLATSESWKDKQSGEKKEATEWHKITAFKKVAEIISSYAKKGDKVYIEGSIKTDKWTDKDGNNRYTTGVIVREFNILSVKGDSVNQSVTTSPKGNNKNNDFDDDIPF